MKIILKEIEINFESWFEKDREPKTREEWIEFFSENIFTEKSVLGEEVEEYQDQVLINSIEVKK